MIAGLIALGLEESDAASLGVYITVWQGKAAKRFVHAVLAGRSRIAFRRIEFDRIYTEIDLGHIEKTWRRWRKSPPGTKMYGVVKTDAYGHGAVPVAKTIDRFVCGYAVATVEEVCSCGNTGSRRRSDPRSGRCSEIRGVHPAELCMPVFELDKAEGMSEAAEKLEKTAHVHIAVDTGMSRIGLRPDTASAEMVKRSRRFRE